MAKKYGNLEILKQQAIEHCQKIHSAFAGRCSQFNGLVGKEKKETSVPNDIIRHSKRLLAFEKIQATNIIPDLLQKKAYDYTPKKRKEKSAAGNEAEVIDADLVIIENAHETQSNYPISLIDSYSSFSIVDDDVETPWGFSRSDYD